MNLPHTKHPVIFQTSAAIPEVLLPWLTAGGSLTAQFECLAGQPLRVKPIAEGFKYLDAFSSQDLQLPRPQMAWVREVALYGNDALPWAKAQSVFPLAALQGKTRRLRYLGSTPLGYVLFGRHTPSCQRIITRTQHHDVDCFTRQNFYHWHRHDILVQETFLPAFLKKISHPESPTE